MSEPRPKYSSKTLVFSGGLPRNLGCGQYPCLYSGDDGPRFFNKECSRQKNTIDYYAFLSERYEFYDETSLEGAISVLEANPKIGGVYSDTAVINNGVEMFIKVNPSYSASIYDSCTMMDIPFVCRSSVVPTFNEEIQNLYLWDGFLDLMSKCMIYHIPKPLFKLNSSMSPVDINSDIEKIKAIHYHA